MNEHAQRLLRDASQLAKEHPQKRPGVSLVNREEYWELVDTPHRTGFDGVCYNNYLRMFTEGAEPLLEWLTVSGQPGTYRVRYQLWTVGSDGTVMSWTWSRYEESPSYMKWDGNSRELRLAFPHVKPAALAPDEVEAFVEDCLVKMHELWG